jgi:hypothetical protein
MVSCQEPSPLKRSKHSLQHHPHDTALVNAHSFVSMGVEARCRPCHSAAHCRHMKRQPSLCHCCPRHGRHHCDCHCRLHHHSQLHCRCCCCHPSLSLSLLDIAVAVAVDHCHCRLCHVAISHCRCRRPPHRPLPFLSLSAIAVAISLGHHRHHRRWPFLRVVALARQELYSNNLSKECLPHFILFGQWAVH